MGVLSLLSLLLFSLIWGATCTEAISIDRCVGTAGDAFKGRHKLDDYDAYNLRLATTNLEFWLDYNHTEVSATINIAQFRGGDIVLDGSDLFELDEISIVFDRTLENARYKLKRVLNDAICITDDHRLIINDSLIPNNLGDGFQINILTHLNPESNTQLFGLYRTRNLLVTQNESSGFRRMIFYPDRPDVLSVFTTIIHADAEKFPVLLSNGNKVFEEIQDNSITAIFHDPYPKPSYLFALAAGPLASIEREVTLGQSCLTTLTELIGSEAGIEDHPLYEFCYQKKVRPYEDVILAKRPIERNIPALQELDLDELAEIFSPTVAENVSNETVSQGKWPAYVNNIVANVRHGSSRDASAAIDKSERATLNSHTEILSKLETNDVDASTDEIISLEYLPLPLKSETKGTQLNSAATTTTEMITGFCPLTSAQNWSGITSYVVDDLSGTNRTASTSSPEVDSLITKRPAICPWKVKVRVWAEKGITKLDELKWSLDSVVVAMLYDEIRFGRYYDLSEFNVVACRDFNAGAMENKGLNIFNEALILADADEMVVPPSNENEADTKAKATAPAKSPQSSTSAFTTDAQYERIRGVIAHEYFHNWSGDRVTVRDWFDLTLKEGLTVFRDQSFTQELSAGSLQKRLRDIDLMESSQFAQDAGPMSHPIRPNSYMTVENFYTVTVYEKGAEVVRMYQQILGAKLFREVLDHFFLQNMDKAATCEDFLAAVKYVTHDRPRCLQGGCVKWDQFFKWYTVSGTPLVRVSNVHWSSVTQQLVLTIEQRLPKRFPPHTPQNETEMEGQHSFSGSTPEVENTPPNNREFEEDVCETNQQRQNPDMVIPISISLIDSVDHSRYAHDVVLLLQESTQTFSFNNIPRRPVISFLRQFSAPVRVESFQSDTDLAFLAVHDDEAYVRFKSLDQLLTNECRKCLIANGRRFRQLQRRAADATPSSDVSTETLLHFPSQCEISPIVTAVFESLFDRLTATNQPDSIYAQLLSLPKISRLKTLIKPFEPDQLIKVVRSIKRQILNKFRSRIVEKYVQLHALERMRPERHAPTAVARRAVKNALLNLMLVGQTHTSSLSDASSGSSVSSASSDSNDEIIKLAVMQLQTSVQANDISAALFALSASGNDPDVQLILSRWLLVHKDQPLLVDRWLTAQMGWLDVDCYNRFKTLMGSELYANSTTPNRLRALASTFAHNPVAFHQARSYELIADEILRWDKFNPKLAAGLATSFNELAFVNDALKQDGLRELDRMLAEPKLSKNVKEVVNSIWNKVQQLVS